MASLSYKEQRYLESLTRRADHLTDRINQAEQNPVYGSRRYDRAELSALRWVLQFVEDTEDAD
jgi:hypothetical protein